MQDKIASPSGSPDHETLRALTRLLIGGSIAGAESLIKQLRVWEEDLEKIRTSTNEPLNDVEASDLSTTSKEENTTLLLRYAFIGWLVESQNRALRRMDQADRITRGMWRMLEPWMRPWLKPLSRSRTLSGLRRRYAGFRARGEDELRRWIALGKQEEQRSRELARLALKRTVDENIAYLAHNPELEQLVETQSSGLANEVVEEVRERTVSADTFLEGLARTLLRRAPRSELPAPPDDVRKMAEGLHSSKRKPSK